MKDIAAKHLLDLISLLQSSDIDKRLEGAKNAWEFGCSQSNLAYLSVAFLKALVAVLEPASEHEIVTLHEAHELANVRQSSGEQDNGSQVPKELTKDATLSPSAQQRKLDKAAASAPPMSGLEKEMLLKERTTGALGSYCATRNGLHRMEQAGVVKKLLKLTHARVAQRVKVRVAAYMEEAEERAQACGCDVPSCLVPAEEKVVAAVADSDMADMDNEQLQEQRKRKKRKKRPKVTEELVVDDLTPTALEHVSIILSSFAINGYQRSMSGLPASELRSYRQLCSKKGLSTLMVLAMGAYGDRQLLHGEEHHGVVERTSPQGSLAAAQALCNCIQNVTSAIAARAAAAASHSQSTRRLSALYKQRVANQAAMQATEPRDTEKYLWVGSAASLTQFAFAGSQPLSQSPPSSVTADLAAKYAAANAVDGDMDTRAAAQAPAGDVPKASPAQAAGITVALDDTKEGQGGEPNEGTGRVGQANGGDGEGVEAEESAEEEEDEDEHGVQVAVPIGVELLTDMLISRSPDTVHFGSALLASFAKERKTTCFLRRERTWLFLLQQLRRLSWRLHRYHTRHQTKTIEVLLCYSIVLLLPLTASSHCFLSLACG
jgi:hypothetical protein